MSQHLANPFCPLFITHGCRRNVKVRMKQTQRKTQHGRTRHNSLAPPCADEHVYPRYRKPAPDRFPPSIRNPHLTREAFSRAASSPKRETRRSRSVPGNFQRPARRPVSQSAMSRQPPSHHPHSYLSTPPFLTPSNSFRTRRLSLNAAACLGNPHRGGAIFQSS